MHTPTLLSFARAHTSLRYEWDGRRDLLYLLSNKPKEEGNAHIFRVVQIQKSHKLVCEIPIILSTEASNPDMAPFNVADVRTIAVSELACLWLMCLLQFGCVCVNVRVFAPTPPRRSLPYLATIVRLRPARGSFLFCRWCGR